MLEARSWGVRVNQQRPQRREPRRNERQRFFLGLQAFSQDEQLVVQLEQLVQPLVPQAEHSPDPVDSLVSASTVTAGSAAAS